MHLPFYAAREALHHAAAAPIYFSFYFTESFDIWQAFKL